jgi:hypothetical protein
MSAFEKLLGELQSAQTETETLQKSLSQTDGGQGAAGGGEGGDGGAGAGGNAGAGGEGGAAGGEGGQGQGAAGGEGGGQTMAKSFKLKLDDGTEVEATDGTEMLKALEQRIDKGEETIAKALGAALGLIKSQSDMIKSLNEKVAKLSNEGRGRKTVISIQEKNGNAGGAGGEAGSGGEGAGGGIKVEEFMAKAQNAFDSKKISGLELTTIDVCLRTKQPIDQKLISKVVAA